MFEIKMFGIEVHTGIYITRYCIYYNMRSQKSPEAVGKGLFTKPKATIFPHYKSILEAVS